MEQGREAAQKGREMVAVVEGVKLVVRALVQGKAGKRGGKDNSYPGRL